MKNVVILLTGAINVEGVKYVKRYNTRDRINDYRKSLSEWLKYTNLKIVFVENTNYPKNKLFENVSMYSNLEYLTYDGRHFAQERGKGYGEFNIIEYAIKNSTFIRNSDIILKCTGRYKIAYAKKLVEHLQLSDSLLIGNYNKKLTFIDTRVIAFTPSFFKLYLSKYKNLINDEKGFYLEHAFASAGHEMLINNNKWEPLPFPLLIDGISGTSNKHHNKGIKKIEIIVKFYLKKVIC